MNIREHQHEYTGISILFHEYQISCQILPQMIIITFVCIQLEQYCLLVSMLHHFSHNYLVIQQRGCDLLDKHHQLKTPSNVKPLSPCTVVKRTTGRTALCINEQQGQSASSSLVQQMEKEDKASINRLVLCSYVMAQLMLALFCSQPLALNTS